MKKVFCKGCMLLSVLLAFSACQEKDIYTPPSSVDNVTDLRVPEGFDWEMSRNVVLSFETPVATGVDVFLSADCREDALVASLGVSQGSEKKISIPDAAENLYVRYAKTDGTQQVIPVKVAGNTRAESKKRVILPEDTGSFNYYHSVMYYPSFGWGTILFEDNWPVLGDYDFNDLAAWYKIQVYTKDNRPEEVEEIMISVRLTAFGGDYPYQLCLQMDELETDDIDNIELYGTSVNGIGKYRLLSKGDEPAVIGFEWDGLRGSYGGKYYNTEKEFEAPSSQLDENIITLLIRLEDEEDMEDFTHDKFNFFIQRKDNGQEIHLAGYEPTKAFRNDYFSIVSENTNLNPEQYYRNKNGFVWGIKVPDGIAHAREGVDFNTAYKLFGDWVTSGGVNHKNWYKEQAGKEYRMDVNNKR